MKISSPWVLLLLASCTTVSNEGADSTLVATDTLASDFIEEGDYSKEIDTTYTEIVQQSGFTGPQIDKRRAYVYHLDGLQVFATPAGTEPLGLVHYRSAVSLAQPLVNNAPSDTITIEGFRGHYAEVSFNGKQGYIFSGLLLNFPVPNDEAVMVDYFTKNLHLIQPAERFTHECDCDDMRSESNYKFESGITVRLGSYYESYDNYVDFDKNVTIQEAFLLARVLLSHFSESFKGYPAEPFKEDKENGGGIEVISNGESITAIVLVTGEGCYEEESIRITQEGNVRLSGNGGC